MSSTTLRRHELSVEHVVTCIASAPPIYVHMAVHRVKFACDVSRSYTKLTVMEGERCVYHESCSCGRNRTNPKLVSGNCTVDLAVDRFFFVVSLRHLTDISHLAQCPLMRCTTVIKCTSLHERHLLCDRQTVGPLVLSMRSIILIEIGYE